MVALLLNMKIREVKHDWSKSSIKALFSLLILIPNVSSAGNVSDYSIGNDTLKWLVPAVVTLLVFTTSQIIIPVVTKYLSDRNLKKTYLKYLRTSADNAISHYGSECNFSFYKSNFIKSNKVPSWLSELEEHGGVPEVFISTETGIAKYQSQKIVDGQDPYIPFLTYTGMPVVELTEEHTLWKLDEKLVPVISSYLLSQHQIKTTLESLYSDKFLEMAKSSNPERREQWAKSYRYAMLDMVEHYRNILKLRDAIK